MTAIKRRVLAPILAGLLAVVLRFPISENRRDEITGLLNEYQIAKKSWSK